MLITIYTYAPKILLVEWVAFLLIGIVLVVIGLYYFLVDIDWHLEKFRDFRDTLYKIIVWPFCLVSFISNYLDIVGIKSLRFGSVLINGIVVGGIFGIYNLFLFNGIILPDFIVLAVVYITSTFLVFDLIISPLVNSIKTIVDFIESKLGPTYRSIFGDTAYEREKKIEKIRFYTKIVLVVVVVSYLYLAGVFD
jgi:hypothetical protein